MPLSALILPSLETRSEAPQLEPASFQEALKAVALPTMAQLPGAGSETYEILRTLCSTLPAYRLRVDRPAPELARLLKEFAP